MRTSGFHHCPKKCRLLFSLLSVTFLGHTIEVTTKPRGPEMGSSSTWGSDSFDIAQRAIHPEVPSTLDFFAALFPWTLPLPSPIILRLLQALVDIYLSYKMFTDCSETYSWRSLFSLSFRPKYLANTALSHSSVHEKMNLSSLFSTPTQNM